MIYSCYTSITALVREEKGGYNQIETGVDTGRYGLAERSKGQILD